MDLILLLVILIGLGLLVALTVFRRRDKQSITVNLGNPADKPKD